MHHAHDSVRPVSSNLRSYRIQKRSVLALSMLPFGRIILCHIPARLHLVILAYAHLNLSLCKINPVIVFITDLFVCKNLNISSPLEVDESKHLA